jgi:hypothetical protein
MRKFNKIINILSESVWVLILVPIVIALIPIIVLILLFMYIGHLYGVLWQKLRNDPAIDIEIKELGDDFTYINTRDEMKSSFTNMAALIGSFSGAELKQIVYSGFETPSAKPAQNEPALLKISQIAITKHATIELFYELQIVIQEDGSELLLPLDEDSESCCPFLPADVNVIHPKHKNLCQLKLDSSHSAWFVICLLRGTTKYTSAGQIWGYIKEHDAWVVRQNPPHSRYGLRKVFRGYEARTYLFDKKPPTRS